MFKTAREMVQTFDKHFYVSIAIRGSEILATVDFSSCTAFCNLDNNICGFAAH